MLPLVLDDSPVLLTVIAYSIRSGYLPIAVSQAPVIKDTRLARTLLSKNRTNITLIVYSERRAVVSDYSGEVGLCQSLSDYA